MTKNKTYFTHNGLKPLLIDDEKSINHAPATLLSFSDRILFLILDSFTNIATFLNTHLLEFANYLNEITQTSEGHHIGIIDKANIDYRGAHNDCAETRFILYEFSSIIGQKNDVKNICFEETGIKVDSFTLYGNVKYKKDLLPIRRKIFKKLYQNMILPLQSVKTIFNFIFFA